MDKTKELDAWIAEHVMKTKGLVGLKKRGYWYRPDAHGYTDRQSEAWHLTRAEAKEHEYLRGEEPVTICEIDTPPYCTDPGAAMMVLEKCAERTPVQILKVVPDGYTYVTSHKLGIESKSEALPMAICQFARKLFEKET